MAEAGHPRSRENGCGLGQSEWETTRWGIYWAPRTQPDCREVVSAPGHICVGEAMDISRSEQESPGADSTGHEKDGSEDSGENKRYQRSDGGKK